MYSKPLCVGFKQPGKLFIVLCLALMEGHSHVTLTNYFVKTLNFGMDMQAFILLSKSSSPSINLGILY
jgi:hypothetical protein